MQTSSLKMGVFLSRKSEANSMETGISVNSSKMERVCSTIRSTSVTVKPSARQSKSTHRQTRVITGSTRDKHHSSASSHHGQIGLESSKGDRVRVKVDSSSHGVDDGFRLLVNLLLHKVIKRSFHNRGQLNLERFDGPNGRDTIITSQAMNVELYPHSTSRSVTPLNA